MVAINSVRAIQAQAGLLNKITSLELAANNPVMPTIRQFGLGINRAEARLQQSSPSITRRKTVDFTQLLRTKNLGKRDALAGLHKSLRPVPFKNNVFRISLLA